MQERLDRLAERAARGLARHTSRRGFLSAFGRVLTGAALVPLLPVMRGSQAQAAEHAAKAKAETTDPNSCEYWKFCAIDGFLCGCCGGSSSSCPPGTQQSPITWIGTCHNPADGRDYIMSYNDCCGKTSCGSCFCNRNEGEKPMYRLSLNNDVNWCMANDNPNYHCSVSVVLGVAGK
ncbi:MAG: amine dehydrogenase [Proteobacteria bacterium]|nr:amine dehydrogenase [Pseudomonadota bacterium]